MKGENENQDFAYDDLYLECETNVLLLSLYLFIYWQVNWASFSSLNRKQSKKKKAQLRHCWTSLHHLLWMGSKRKTLQKTVGAQKEAWWKLEAHSLVNDIKINLFIPWLVWSTEVSALRECKKCLGGWLLQMTLGVTVDGAQCWMTRWLAVSRTESGKLDEDSKRSEREGERKEKWKLWGILKRKVEECNTSRKEPLRGCFWRRAEHVSGWRGFSLISKTTVAVCVCESMESVNWYKLNVFIQVLMYSGQLDVIVAAPLTERFLPTVNWTGATEYKKAPRFHWKVQPTDTEVAGYVRQVGEFYQVSGLWNKRPNAWS